MANTGTRAQYSARQGTSKYGGLTRSPLTSQTEVWEEFSKIASGIDPDTEWNPLALEYMRDWIQGMWIVKSLQESKQ